MQRSLNAEEIRLAGGVPVLARLEAQEREEVLRSARVETYPAGAVVVHQGYAGDAFYVVLAGRIEVATQADGGQEIRLTELGPGTWFGEQALLTPGGRRTATVRALEPLSCAVIPASAFSAYVAPANRAVFDEAAAENLRSRLVRSLDALRGLDPSRRLGAGVASLSFRPGEVVFERGQAADAVYFVRDGIAVAVRDEEGRGSELARLGPGQCFGELGVLDGQVRRASVVAETELEVLRIEASLFRTLYAEHPPLRDFLGTLQRVYALADGRRLSVYRGEIEGRPSISTVCGDPAGDCVVSTKVLGEDVVVLRGLGRFALYAVGLGVPVVLSLRRRAVPHRPDRAPGSLRDFGRTVVRILGFLRPGFHPRERDYPFEEALQREVSRYPVDAAPAT